MVDRIGVGNIEWLGTEPPSEGFVIQLGRQVAPGAIRKGANAPQGESKDDNRLPSARLAK